MASQDSIDMRALQQQLMLAPISEPQPQAIRLGGTYSNENVESIGNGVGPGDGRPYTVQLPCSLEAALGFKQLSQPKRVKMSTQGSGDKTQEFAEGELEAVLAKGKAEREGYFQNENRTGNDDQTKSDDQTGHIDLLGNFQQSVVEKYDEDDDDVFEDISQTKAEIFPESQRFLQPKTPVTDGGKRMNIFATPSLPVNPFIGNGAQHTTMMGLSQVFNNTQPSSPFRNDLPSDMPSELPSPALFNTLRSPTAPGWSSPTKKDNDTEHTPRAQRSTAVKNAVQDESSYDGFDSSEESLLRRQKRMRRKIEEQTRKEFAMVTAPSRETRNVRGKGTRRGNGEDTGLLSMKTKSLVQVERLEESTEDETDDDDDLENVQVHSSVVKNGTGGRAVQASFGGSRGKLQDADNSVGFRKCGSTKATAIHRSIVTSDAVALQDSQGSISVHTTRRVEVENSQPLQSPEATRDSQIDGRWRLPEMPSPLDGCVLGTQPRDSGVTSSYIRRENEAEVINNESSCLPQPPSSSFQERSSTFGSPSQRRSRSGTKGNRMEVSHKLVVHSSSQSIDVQRDAIQRSSPPQFVPQNSTDQDEAVVTTFSPGLGGSLEEPELDLPHPKIGKDGTTAYPIDDLRTPLPTKARILTGDETTIPETSPAARDTRFHLHKRYNHSSQYTPMPPPKDSRRVHFGVSDSGHQTLESSDTTLFETAQSNIGSLSAAHANDSDDIGIATETGPDPQSSKIQSISERATVSLAPDGVAETDIDPLTAEAQSTRNQISTSPPAKRKKGSGNTLVVHTRSKTQVSSVSHGEEELQNAHLGDPTKIVLARSNATHQATGEQGNLRPFKSAGKSKSTSNVGGISVAAKASVGIREPTTPKAKKKAEKTYLTKPITAGQAGKANPAANNGRVDSDNAYLAPNRVLALFRDKHMNYYPATCLLAYGNEEHSSYMIRFDDGSEGLVDSSHVRRMELKVGDTVKVDEPNMRKNYIVSGFCGKIKADAAHDLPLTDSHGYSTILLRGRQRDSTSTEDDSFSGEEISVSMSKIYLPRTMWHKFNDRTYTHLYDMRPAVSGGPCSTGFTSGASTPARSHRMSSVMPGQSPKSVALAPFRLVSGIFSGMVFAVTYLEKGSSKRAEVYAERDKENIIELILNNGGKLLRDGFEELFEPDWLAPVGSINGQPLRLKANSKRLGFTCAIANDHSRKPKYMGALALGLPCLHGRWIVDCAAQDAILDWEPYLLAAGKSAYLGDVVKSRSLQPYGAIDAELEACISSRPNFLHGQSIMLVTKNEARRNQFLFLVYALGVSKVGKAANLSAAKKLLAEAEDSGQSWDWVCVEGSQVRNVRDAFAGVKPGKKRKRIDEDAENEEMRTFNVKVMSEEHVMQSLIMGIQFEETSIET